MMDYQELEKEILWVIKHYGSDAQERKKPGSKAIAQAKRIVEFVYQWETVNNFIETNDIDLISLKGIIQ